MLINNRYQVIRPLGEGGFGHAYLAEDTQMPSRRKCVIKQLKPITTSPEVYQVVQDRFQREAAILEQLGENNRQIPRLYAYFSEDQQFYLVQEWIEGETLEEIAVPQSETAVLSLLTSLLPVLAFIHGQGIIHRDLKPENIILRSGNHQPVLIDFGAVRETMGTVMNNQNHPTSSIVIGTPGYMSAEQAIGRPVPSSDLYSLGLTAIFLLTGQIPQSFTTDGATGEIIWQSWAQHVSPGLQAVLARAVRSHPRDRFASATEMLNALSNLSGAQISDAQISDAPIADAHPADITSPSAPTVITPTPAIPPNSPQQSHPPTPAQTSQLKTMAVAPAAQSFAHPPNQALPNQALPNQAGTNTRVTGSSGTEQQSASNRLPNQQARKKATPLVIGLVAAVITSGAIAAGLIANRKNQTSPLFDASTQSTSESTINSQTETTPSVDLSQTQDFEGIDPNEVPNEQAQILVPNPLPIEEDFATWVTLAGGSSQKIDIYAQPSFESVAPHYGVGGDRVLTAGETYQQSGGPLWTRIKFQSSGVAGWIPEFQIAAESSEPPVELPPEPETPEIEPPEPPEPELPELEPPEIEPPSLENAPKYTQLKGPPSDRINVRAAPSSTADSPHYAVGGDAIQILDIARGEDGYDWYLVAFESGADGWVRADLIELP